MIGDWKDFQRDVFNFHIEDLTLVPSHSDKVWYVYNNITKDIAYIVSYEMMDPAVQNKMMVAKDLETLKFFWPIFDERRSRRTASCSM